MLIIELTDSPPCLQTWGEKLACSQANLRLAQSAIAAVVLEESNEVQGRLRLRRSGRAGHVNVPAIFAGKLGAKNGS